VRKKHSRAKLPDFVVGRNQGPRVGYVPKPSKVGSAVGGEAVRTYKPRSKQYSISMCMKPATRDRIVSTARAQGVNTDTMLNVLLTYFGDMSPDWQAALMRGEKINPPAP
jgi:hypothetical protein